MLPFPINELLAKLVDNEEAQKFIVTPPANPGVLYAFREPYYLFQPGVFTQSMPSHELTVLTISLARALEAYALTCDLSMLRIPDNQVTAGTDTMRLGELDIVAPPVPRSTLYGSVPQHRLGWGPVGVWAGAAIFPFSSREHLVRESLRQSAGLSRETPPSMFGWPTDWVTSGPTPAWGQPAWNDRTPGLYKTDLRHPPGPSFVSKSGPGRLSMYPDANFFQRDTAPDHVSMGRERAAEQDWRVICERRGWWTDQSTQITLFETFLRREMLFGKFLAFAEFAAADEDFVQAKDVGSAHPPQEENPPALTEDQVIEQKNLMDGWHALCKQRGWDKHPLPQLEVGQLFLDSLGLGAQWRRGDWGATPAQRLSNMEEFIRARQLFGPLRNFALSVTVQGGRGMPGFGISKF